MIRENIILSQYKIDSRELFLDLFKTTEKKYEQIQVILHIVSCAATKVSCESVLETFVSEFEYAINSRKNWHGKEGHVRDLQHHQEWAPHSIPLCDKVVKESLDSMFGGNKWHFVTKTPWKSSQVSEKMKKTAAALPFMT